MTRQTRDLIEAGYVTRKQAATILGKGDGGNIVTLCKHGGVRMIQIPYGTKTTAMFWGEDVVRLFAKMDKKNRPKQAELPVAKYGGFHLEGNKPVKNETIGFYHAPAGISDSEIMDALGRIEAMLTALLKR
jgi:hypothetical protein